MNTKPSADLGVISQAVALASLLLYVLGFIVVNAHLARWDAASFDFANAQYLAAGLLFAVFAAVFGFMVGLRIYYLKHDFVELASLGRDFKWPLAWVLFCFVEVIAELSFSFVVGAYWTASLFFEQTSEQIVLAGVLAVFFVVDYYALWNRNIYKQLPHVALPIGFAFHIAVVVAAFWWFPDPQIVSIVLVYCGIGFVLNFVIDMSQRVAVNYYFSLFWAAVFVLGTAATFGSFIYGHVKSGIGGGRVRYVELIFSSSAPDALRTRLAGPSTDSGRLIMVAETSDAIFLSKTGDQGDVVRVAKSEIAGVISFTRKAEWEANQPSRPTSGGAAER